MSPLFTDPPPESLSRRAKVSSFVCPLYRFQAHKHFCNKFYGFLSRSSSRSRSRSKGDGHPSDSASNESPDPQNATTVTFTSMSGTSDSHYATSPTSTSRPRSPSRPLSDNTITTGDTVTPKKWQTRTSRASRAHHHVRPISPHLINDSGIGVNEPLIAYDPRMPPPPVPASALLAQPTTTKEKRRSKPLFGLPWSRPIRPTNEQVSTLPSPQSPPSHPSGVLKIENMFRIGALSFDITSGFIVHETDVLTFPRPTIGGIFVVPPTDSRSATEPTNNISHSCASCQHRHAPTFKPSPYS